MAYDWTEHNYHGDYRVINSRAQREFNEGFDAEAMTFTFTKEEEDGEEVSYTLPARYEVCPTCEGRGNHVDPSIDAGGISSDSDFWDDDEDEEGNSRYRSGFYNVTCYTCGGRTTVPAIDRASADKAALALWDEIQEEDAEYEAMCRAERRMGA
jgi:hypothetical protein